MKTIFFILLFLIISCASDQQTSEEKIYSDDDINRPALIIEQQRTPNDSHLKKAPLSPQIQGHAKKYERLVEINQKLAFFCMQHRKNKTFEGSEEKCMKFVTHALKTCHKKNTKVNSQVMTCLNHKLKRR